MFCASQQSWVQQHTTSCKPTSCMTPIIKQDPLLKPCWRVKKCWLTKPKDCSALPAHPSEAHVCLRSSTDTLAILTLPLSPAIPPLPPSFLLYLTFAGQQAEASVSASSFPQVIQIHHWPIYNTRQNTVLFAHWLTRSMAASISAPGERTHTFPALDRSQTSDYH